MLDASSWLSDDEYDVQKMELLQFVQAAAKLDQEKDEYDQSIDSTDTSFPSSCSIRISVVQFGGQEVETSCPLACASDAIVCIHNMQRLTTNYLTGLRPLSFGEDRAQE